MKGILQYSTLINGPFKSAGVIRTRREQEYIVKPITDTNRNGLPELIAFNVKVSARALELNDILVAPTYYFRILFPAELQEIRLGQRSYFPQFNALLDRNNIFYHIIELDFNIDIDEYVSYVVPVNLAESEENVLLEETPIYIE